MTDNETTEPIETPNSGSNLRWCVLRVASNREDHVKESLIRKVQIEGLQEEVARILVPTEKVKSVRGSQTRVYERKLYPGYVFMEINLDETNQIPERAWFVIKETQGVGEFIGTGGKPSPMSDTDVAKMLQQTEAADQPSIHVEFSKGDAVKIKGGSFEGFEGTVENIDNEKGTVRVIVSIFGRATPLDIEYWQIEKV